MTRTVTDVPLIIGVVAAIFGSTLLGRSAHALECPDPPKQAQQSVAVDVSLELKALKRFLGEAAFGTKVATSTTNLYEKYPNADKLVLAQMILSVFCSMVRDTTDLSSVEKMRLFSETRDQILRLAPAQPRSDRSREELVQLLQRHAAEIVVTIEDGMARPTKDKSKHKEAEYIADLKRTRALFLVLHSQHIDALRMGNLVLAHELARDIHHLFWLTEHIALSATGEKLFDRRGYKSDEPGFYQLVWRTVDSPSYYAELLYPVPGATEATEEPAGVDFSRIKRLDAKLTTVRVE